MSIILLVWRFLSSCLPPSVVVMGRAYIPSPSQELAGFFAFLSWTEMVFMYPNCDSVRCPPPAVEDDIKGEGSGRDFVPFLR